MLDKELTAFDRLRSGLLNRDEGKYALVYGDQLVEIFNSRLDAINHGYHELGNVAFLVKKIQKEDPPSSFFTEKEDSGHADL